MIVDSHQHVMLPASMQITKMDDAGVDKVILFTTTPHDVSIDFSFDGGFERVIEVLGNE